MKKLLVLAILAASSALAQSTTRIVEVKHVDPHRIARMIKLFGVAIEADPELKIVSIGGPPEMVKAAEEAIRRLDVPSSARNIEAVFYVVMASQKDENSPKIPAELDSVIKQLKTVSAYQHYRLLETIQMRVRENRSSQTKGRLPVAEIAPGQPNSATYMLALQRVSVDVDPKAGHIVHLTDLIFKATIPYQAAPGPWQFNENMLSTSIDVREGQKVVIGKANVDGSDSALILIVTVKVMD